jgi:hypothetical protein
LRERIFRRLYSSLPSPVFGLFGRTYRNQYQYKIVIQKLSIFLSDASWVCGTIYLDLTIHEEAVAVHARPEDDGHLERSVHGLCQRYRCEDVKSRTRDGDGEREREREERKKEREREGGVRSLQRGCSVSRKGVSSNSPSLSCHRSSRDTLP